MRLEFALAHLAKLSNTFLAVVLQMSVFCGNVVGVTAFSQTGEGKVIVERKYTLGVVEALGVSTWFGVVPGSVHVLQHVHVLGYILIEAMFLLHGVQEVHVARSEGGTWFLVRLESVFD